MKRAALAAAALIGALGLAGCETPARTAIPSLTFAHLEPVRFDAAIVEIDDQYRPALTDPNVEHLFPISPASAVRTWVEARIIAAGAGGSVRVIIEEASVVRTELPIRQGLEGLFFYEQNVRYDAALKVGIEYRREIFIESSVRAQVTRSRTAPENITVDQRNLLFFAMTEDLLRDLDAEILRNIQAFMTAALL